MIKKDSTCSPPACLLITSPHLASPGTGRDGRSESGDDLFIKHGGLVLYSIRIKLGRQVDGISGWMDARTGGENEREESWRRRRLDWSWRKALAAFLYLLRLDWRRRGLTSHSHSLDLDPDPETTRGAGRGRAGVGGLRQHTKLARSKSLGNSERLELKLIKSYFTAPQPA